LFFSELKNMREFMIAVHEKVQLARDHIQNELSNRNRAINVPQQPVADPENQ
jgi:hypothetical protein